MISIEETNVHGWEAAIRGMRNPMNSWEKSDSGYSDISYSEYVIGPNDHKLMTQLAKAGTEHSKYRRFITVTADITAPLYWWKEYDTYKVGTVANSCSTMHKIHAKEFTLEDFSCEHLFQDNMVTVGYGQNDFRIISNRQWLLFTCELLNSMRKAFLETKDQRFWWQMIQLLPSSYNQRRTVMLNYENLAAIYRQRKDHKLDEWHTFCEWVEGLPFSELITLKEPE